MISVSATRESRCSGCGHDLVRAGTAKIAQYFKLLRGNANRVDGASPVHGISFFADLMRVFHLDKLL
jgi:hypothetical protein